MSEVLQLPELGGRPTFGNMCVGSRGAARFRSGSVAAHLAGVPADRIRQLASALQRGLNDTIDEIDVVTMRLLLNDYISGVGHFRAIARTAASRMDHAAELIREGQRFVHREQKLEARRAAQRADAGVQS